MTTVLVQRFGQEIYTYGDISMRPQIQFGDPPFTLRAHQIMPIRALLNGQRGLLIAHGIGSGKTLTAIACAINSLRLGIVSQIVIVVPLKLLMTQWLPSLKKFAPTWQSKIDLTTQEQLQLILEEQEDLAGGTKDMLSKLVQQKLRQQNEFEVEGDIIPQEDFIAWNESAGSVYFKVAQNIVHDLFSVKQLGAGINLGAGLTGPLDLSKALVIFDEAHRLRNLHTNDQSLAIQINQKAARLITMTATPFINGPVDASIHFSMFEKRLPSCDSREVMNPGWLPLDEATFKAVYLTEDTFVSRMEPLQASKVANWLSVHNLTKSVGLPEYPKVQYVPSSETTVFMSNLQHFFQSEAESKLKVDANGDIRANSFQSQTRQQCNTIATEDISSREKDLLTVGLSVKDIPFAFLEPKLQNLVQEIEVQLRVRQDRLAGRTTFREELPVIVYSEFLERGIFRVGTILKRLFARYKIANERILQVTGATDDKTLANIGALLQKPLNQDVLLISGSGTEGLDTKGVRQMHILEPPWNQSILDQTLGRAIRYRSHEALPLQEQLVRVFFWQVQKTEEQKSIETRKGIFHLEKSTDQYIYDLIAKKKNLNAQFVNLLEDNSLEALIGSSTFREKSITNPTFGPWTVEQRSQFKDYRKLFGGSTNSLVTESTRYFDSDRAVAWSKRACKVVEDIQDKMQRPPESSGGAKKKPRNE